MKNDGEIVHRMFRDSDRRVGRPLGTGTVVVGEATTAERVQPQM